MKISTAFYIHVDIVKAVFEINIRCVMSVSFQFLNIIFYFFSTGKKKVDE